MTVEKMQLITVLQGQPGLWAGANIRFGRPIGRTAGDATIDIWQDKSFKLIQSIARNRQGTSFMTIDKTGHGRRARQTQPARRQEINLSIKLASIIGNRDQGIIFRYQVSTTVVAASPSHRTKGNIPA